MLILCQRYYNTVPNAAPTKPYWVTRIGVNITDKTRASAFENIALLPPYQNEYAGGYSSSYTNKNSLGAGYLDDQGYYIFNYDPAAHPASWSAFQGQRMLEYGADESWGPTIDGNLYRAYWSWYPGAEFGQLTPVDVLPEHLMQKVSLRLKCSFYVIIQKYHELNVQ